MTERGERVKAYVIDNGWLSGEVRCSFLAAGEYNENYLVENAGGRYVFRINHGTQLGLENQIEYEFQVLQAVSRSGVTPRPYRCSRKTDGLGDGVLLMEFLDGRPLDYRQDLPTAALIFARIHELPADDRLIVQPNPAQDIGAEALGMIHRHDGERYRNVRARLLDYHDEIVDLAPSFEKLLEDEPRCIVNTEVNSANFIVSGGRGWLVDWEKAVVSCRYQDLAHFLAPTTTLWRSDYRFDPEQRRAFLHYYQAAAGLERGVDELLAKTALMERVILLRALSWCYMAYQEYTGPGRPLVHDRTLRTIRSYLEEISCFLP